MKQKFTSANTSINSKKAPAIYGMKRAIDIMRGKNVIDIGGGKFDTAIQKASEYDAVVRIYDKFNRSMEHNKIVLSAKYDVSVISNVLNVIDSAEERANVLRLAAEKGKIILITVYEGNKSGIGEKSGVDSWQENRKTVDYMDEIKNVLIGKTIQRFGKLIVCT